MVGVGDVLLNHLHSLGHFLAILVKLHIVKFQVEDIPLATID